MELMHTFGFSNNHYKFISLCGIFIPVLLFLITKMLILKTDITLSKLCGEPNNLMKSKTAEPLRF